MQFTAEDDERFWFYSSMHFPEPMCLLDTITAEAAYCVLGSANTRVYCLPTTFGIDYRIINGRICIGGNAVTDAAEIPRRTAPEISLAQKKGVGPIGYASAYTMARFRNGFV
jgi:pyruvate, water dikinase